MVYSLYFGGFGFLCILIYDLSQLYNHPAVTRITSFIGFSSVILALFLEIFLYRPSFSQSSMLIPKYIVMLASLTLLIYSLFVETAAGAPDSAGNIRTAVTDGTYSLSRHPGFLWFLCLQISINWLCGRVEVIIIGVTLSIMDYVLIVLEDIWIFPRLFSNYEEYKKSVPMIIPGLKGKR